MGNDPDPVRHQVSGIPPVKAEVTEYQQHRLSCPACGEVTAAEWPQEMPSGSFGPRVQAIVGYLTGRLALSHRDVVEAMAALHGLSLSLGSVSTIQDHVSKALEQPVRTAQQYVHRQPVNQVDETIWPEGEKQKWLWIDATSEMTVFRILAGRGQAQAKEVIGKGYQGIINTDRYPGYHWMDAHRRQLCWAHLKREFLAIKGRGGMSAEIGDGLLEQVKEIFEAWRAERRGLEPGGISAKDGAGSSDGQRVDSERRGLWPGQDAADLREPAQTRDLTLDLHERGRSGTDQ
jgi:hypothetical protein